MTTADILDARIKKGSAAVCLMVKPIIEAHRDLCWVDATDLNALLDIVYTQGVADGLGFASSEVNAVLPAVLTQPIVEVLDPSASPSCPHCST